MEKTVKNDNLADRVKRSFLDYLMVTGLIANLICGNFIYKEYSNPGSAVMVGDLKGITGAKGK